MAEADSPLAQAGRWLARREYSVHELERRLAGKGYAGDAIHDALAALTSQGLVSDRRFAESLVRSRIERGYGPVRIAQELRLKGIDDALVAEVLDAGDDSWVARLELVWRKRFGRAPENYRDWARQARGLQARGFTAEQVRRVVPEVDA